MCGALVSNHRGLSYFFLPTLLFDIHEIRKMHAMAVHFLSRGVECLCKSFALVVTILSLEGIERSKHEALSTCAHKMWIIVLKLKLGKLMILDFNVVRICEQLIKEQEICAKF